MSLISVFGGKGFTRFSQQVKPYIPLIIGLIIFVTLLIAFSPYRVDDAYISFTYAKNLVYGHGLTFNGMAVEGYSNFLWTVVIALFIRLGSDPLVAARGISIICALGIFFITHELIKRFYPQATKLSVSLILFLLITNSEFCLWVMGGLETIWVCFWVLLVVYFETDSRHELSLLSSLAMFACILSRPEGVILFPIVIIYHWFDQKKITRDLAVWGLLLAFVSLFFLVLRWIYYGDIVPNTFYLKVRPGIVTLLNAVHYLTTFISLRPFWGLLLILSALVFLLNKVAVTRGWFLGMVVVVFYILFILISGPDWIIFHRYIITFFPLLSIFVGGVVVKLCLSSITKKVIAVSIVFAAVALELILPARLLRPVTITFGNFVAGQIKAATWVRDHTNPQDTIAVVDAGIFSYYSERRTIDIVGLNDRHIATSITKSDPSYVLSQQPAIIQVHAYWDGSHWKAKDAPAAVDLTNQPDFQVNYVPAWLQFNDPYWPTIFIRQR